MPPPLPPTPLGIRVGDPAVRMRAQRCIFSLLLPVPASPAIMSSRVVVCVESGVDVVVDATRVNPCNV